MSKEFIDQTDGTSNHYRGTATVQGTLRQRDGADGKIGTPVFTTSLIANSDYADAARECVRHAQREVRICAYAWRWYHHEPELGIQQFNMELVKLKNRGIRVRALVDNYTMKRMLEAEGIEARAVENNKLLHTKAICADEKALIIGSHNLTKRATRENYEMSVAINEYEPIAQFIEYFDRMWNAYG